MNSLLLKKRNPDGFLKVLCIIFLTMLVTTAIKAQVVNIDKLDYAPGETVQITGSGWQGGEEITLEVQHISTPIPDHGTPDPHLPWTLTADESGNFSSMWNVSDYESNAELLLVASGTISGARLEIFFTDAGRTVTTVNVSSQNSDLSYGNSGNLTYNLTINTDGSGNLNPITLSYSGLPSGVVASFSPSTLSANNLNTSPGSVLTLTVPNTLNAANYSFTLTASYGQGKGTVNVTTNGNLVISKSDPIIAVSGYTGVFDGNSHGATGIIKGVKGEVLSGFNPGESFINVPGGNASWSFNDITGNYNDKTGSVEIKISKADSKVVVTGYEGTYDANAHKATGSATGVNGVDLASGLNMGNSFTDYPGGTANWTFTGGTNYKDQSGSVEIKISKADAKVVVIGYEGTYDANAHKATGTATGVNGVDLASGLNLGNSFTDYPGGTASWTFTGGTNYKDQSGSVDINISKADATVVVNGYEGVYDAQSHGATGTATGVNGVDLASGLNLGNNFTDYPGGTANWTFTGGTNYKDQSGSVAIKISKADATVVVNGYEGVYDAASHGASGTATGVNGVDLVSGLNLGNSFTDYPGGTANWTFTGGTNYKDQSGSVEIKISKADATVVVNGYEGVYNAASHGATGTATGVNGVDLASGLNLGNNFTDYPGGTANWTFTGGTNYKDQSGSVAIKISKADATVVVNGYEGVYDAQSHSATGTSTGVNGIDLASGLNLGNSFTDYPGGTANWTFTGGTNYKDQTGSVDIKISKADATVVLNGYEGVYDAQSHGATGTSTGVNGVDLASGLNLGNNFTDYPGGTASWTFTGGTNYKDQNGSVEIKISKADATVVVSGYEGVYDAQSHGATGTTTGVNGVDLASGLNLGNSFTDYPGGTASWTFTGGTNYKDQNGSVEIKISKADATIVVSGYEGVYDAQSHGATGTATGVNGVDLASGLNLGNSFADYPGGTASWTFTGGTNYKDQSGSVAIKISKADATVVVTGYEGVYDAASHGASGTATGVNGVDLASGLNLGNSFTDYPGGTANWTFTGGTNYKDQSGSVDIEINKRDLNVTAIGINKIYDGTTNATVKLSDNRVTGDVMTLLYTSANFASANVGNAIQVSVEGITKIGEDANNYNFLNTTASTSANITQASTSIALTLSGSHVRYMDNLTLTAVIVPLNTGSAITGNVDFVINGKKYGSVAVIPVPGAVDGSVKAMLIKQVFEMPGDYTVTATFMSANSNYSGSNDSKSLKVDPRDASYAGTGFYTGDVFVWTTSASSSTGTVTLATTIKDNNIPNGDVRGAKVTFYYVNGGKLTPIPGASNLSVGLVDASDGSTGTASAVIQLNIGSQNVGSYTIAVGISGAYFNDPYHPAAEEIVTVSKPVPGGFIVGGGSLLNTTSSGLLKGAYDLTTGFSFDVSFNNKLTNPQGKVNLILKSYNKPDGTLDKVLHTYLIASNAISVLSVGKPDKTQATFSSKANLVEQLNDGTLVPIEGGSILQLTMTDKGSGSAIDMFSASLQRKAGGLWFTSSWDGSKTVERILNTGSLYVSTSGFSQTSTILKSGSLVQDTQVETKAPVEFKNSLNVYPNPSSGPLNFKFTIAESARVTIDIKSMSGKAVARIFDADVMAGDSNMVEYNDALTPGIYIYQMRWNDQVITGKISIAY